MNIDQYFSYIQEEVNRHYQVAEAAKAKGFDPISSVEVSQARSLAEKTVGLVSVIYPQVKEQKIIDRILDLEKEFGQLDVTVSFKIAEEIAREKFCKFENLLQAIDAGIRVGFAYITLGVVSSPIEGYTELKLGKTKKGEDYFIAYFSGPIRSAGTTASCVVLMIIDYLRELFGFAKYDPSEEEVRRYVTENYDYHERVTNLQYLPTEEEISFLAKNLPIQIAGEPTESREVSNYKDLARVETNFIRGGMCLIFSEGLAQKAQKGFRLLKGAKANGIQTSGWDFLEEYIALHGKREKKGSDSSPTYIKDIVAGRPVFGHPSASGSFRFRYGRSRNNGFSAMSVHPATMGISDSFISSGAQLKIEKPTKGCAVSSCDGIDGPIAKLRDGSVKRFYDFDSAKSAYNDVEEIIYFGDILVPVGDVMNRNYELIKPGYVEEWWELELAKLGGKLEVDKTDVDFESALNFSRDLGLPLHPKYIYYWSQINYSYFLGLLDWLARGEIKEGKLVLPYTKEDRERFGNGKRALELIGCEHKVSIENVVLSERDSKAFLINLGINLQDNLEKRVDEIVLKIPKEGKVLEIVDSLSEYKIKDKAGTFIGARMGRPEKAKLRKLTGSPHVLFPVGVEGGRLRSVQSAVEVGSVRGEFPLYYCEKCKKEEIFPVCDDCGERCKKLNYCYKCDKNVVGKCEDHQVVGYKPRRIDVKTYFNNAKKRLGIRIEELPAAVKGVRGTSSENHDCEVLGKGLLRAKHNLNVNKDGTIRYDISEMPLTHFKPREVGTSVEKLKELGYEKDIYGNSLIDDDQILEIFPHDVVLPACPDSPDERADDVFLNVANFIDDELEGVYGLKRYFNYNNKKDLPGTFLGCISPHNCAAVVGRIVGFSKVQGLLASPYMHAAMRRDCDGDEAAVVLLMDMLVNFSKKFLPSHRGGTQDSPLVLNVRLKAGEVDDQILDFEVEKYPLELYELAEQGKHSSELKIRTVKDVLREEGDAFSGLAYTHQSSDVSQGVVNSSYKSLPSMKEKVAAQMGLCSRLRSVDTSDVARLVIERHFIRDIRGNFRKFSMQVFRCVGCNEKFRRPPLAGKCTKCGGKIIFTISEGSIMKYLQEALNLGHTYHVSPYLIECLDLVERDIVGVFGKEKEKQETLGSWIK